MEHAMFIIIWNSQKHADSKQPVSTSGSSSSTDLVQHTSFTCGGSAEVPVICVNDQTLKISYPVHATITNIINSKDELW